LDRNLFVVGQQDFLLPELSASISLFVGPPGMKLQKCILSKKMYLGIPSHIPPLTEKVIRNIIVITMIATHEYATSFLYKLH
jgi:hypothetical protein